MSQSGRYFLPALALSVIAMLASFRLFPQIRDGWLAVIGVGVGVVLVAILRWRMPGPVRALRSLETWRGWLLELIEFVEGIRWYEWASLGLIPLTLVDLYVRGLDLRLTSLDDRVLGSAVLQNADVAGRTQAVVIAVLLALGVLVLLLVLLHLLAGWWAESDPRKASFRLRLLPLHVISLVIVVAALIYYPTADHIVTIYLHLAVLIVVLALYSYTVVARRFHAGLLLALAAAGWSLSFVGMVDLGQFSTVWTQTLLVMWLAVLALVFLVPLILIPGGRRDRVAEQIIAFACIPLVLLPGARFWSTEIAYTIFRRSETLISMGTVRVWIVGVMILLSLAIIVIGFTVGRRWRWPRVSPTVRNLVMPCLIFSMILGQYAPPPGAAMTDLFHPGEEMIPVQQLLVYGKLPYVDILPTHGLLGLAVGSLHYAMTGYIGMDTTFFIGSILAGVYALVGYLFLRQFFKSALLAVFFVLILSVITLQTGYYVFTLLGLIPLARLVQWPTRTRAWQFGGALALLIALGRIDASLVFLIIVGVVFVLRFGLRPRDLKTVLLPAFAPTAGLVALYLALLVARLGVSGAVDRLHAIANFLSVDFQAMSTGRIEFIGTNSEPLHTFVYVFLFPVIVLLLCGLLVLGIVRGALRRQPVLTTPFIALSGGIFALMLWLRVFQRHTPAEAGITGTLITGLMPLAILLLAWCFTRGSRHYVWVVAALVATTTLITLTFNQKLVAALFHAPDDLAATPIIYSPTGSRFDDISQVANPDAIVETREFLQRNLGEGQTAAIVTTDLMVYAFFDLEFRSFYIPNLYMMGDEIQAQFLRDIPPDEVPFVLVDEPQTAWADSLPDPIRNYRIYEHLYQDYYPVMNDGNFLIFASRSLPPENITFASQQRPAAVSDSLFANALRYELTPDNEFVATTEGDDPYLVVPLVERASAGMAEDAEACEVTFEINTQAAGDYQVFYSAADAWFEDGRSVAFPVPDTGGEWQAMTLPVSGEVDQLRLDGPETGSAVEFAVRNLNVMYYVPENYVRCGEGFDVYGDQAFNLYALPWLWANHDEANVLETGAVLRTLYAPPASEAEREIADVSFEQIGAARFTEVEVDAEGVAQMRFTGPDPWVQIDLPEAEQRPDEYICQVDFDLRITQSGTFEVFIWDVDQPEPAEQSGSLVGNTFGFWQTVQLPFRTAGVMRLRLDGPTELTEDQVYEAEVRNLRLLYVPNGECDTPDGLLLGTGHALEVSLDPAFDGNVGDYIHLNLAPVSNVRLDRSRKTVNGIVVQYVGQFGDEPADGGYRFTPELGRQDYLVRASMQYNWVASDEIRALRVENNLPVPVYVRGLSLLNGD